MKARIPWVTGELQEPDGRRGPGEVQGSETSFSPAALPWWLWAGPSLSGGVTHCSLISGSQ